MSKFVKNIITEELKKRLAGVENALLVNIVGMALWVVHDLHYWNIVSVVFDVGAIVTTTIGMMAVLKERRTASEA